MKCETCDSDTLNVKCALFTHRHVCISTLAWTLIGSAFLVPHFDLKLNLTLTPSLNSQKALCPTLTSSFSKHGLILGQIGPHTDRHTIAHTHTDRGGLTLAWQHPKMYHTCMLSHPHTNTLNEFHLQEFKNAHRHAQPHTHITPGATMCVHLRSRGVVLHLTLQKSIKKTSEHLSSCDRSPLHHTSSPCFIHCFPPFVFHKQDS